MKDLRSFQRDILFIVYTADNESPLNGQEVKEQLKQYRAEAKLTNARLYQNLTELSEEGYVEVSDTGAKENNYTLTETGRELISDHREWHLKAGSTE